MNAGPLAAIGRDEIADYVAAVFLVYTILIFIRILLSWVYVAGRGLPQSRPIRAAIEFVHQTTDPYLNLFRRVLPPIGGSRMALDLSPIIAIIVLFVVRAVVVGLIRGVSSEGRAWRLALIVCGAVVVLDQVAKAIVVSEMLPGESIDLALGLELVRTSNTGVAFGLLSGGGDGPVLAFTVVALGLLAFVFARDPGQPYLWLAVGLIGGGALGNLADRVRDGAVVDYIDPPYWPAFNIADIAITCGVAILILVMLQRERSATAAVERPPG